MTRQQWQELERKHPTTHYCDCGRPATKKFNGWECDRCRQLRLEHEHERDDLHRYNYARGVAMAKCGRKMEAA